MHRREEDGTINFAKFSKYRIDPKKGISFLI